MPNWSQISGVVERLVWVVVTWLVAKGTINPADAGNLAGLVLGVLAAIYAYVVNRNANLAKQAASIPGTLVVTDPLIAYNVMNPNVVSNTQVEVKSK